MTQPTLSVLDSAGVQRTINTANPNGQATAANSLPVVLASDQVLPLAVGAATDANITAIGTTQHTDLVAILTKLVSNPATDANLSSSAAAIVTAIATMDTDLQALTVAQHTDLSAILGKLTSGSATDANMTAIGATTHTDLTALLTKVPTLPTGASETNRAVTTVANTAIQLMAANPNRKYFELQNLSTTTPLYFRKDGTNAAANTPGTFSLAPGAFYSGQSVGSISIISTIANHPFTAVEA
jgi:hypothetical protein